MTVDSTVLDAKALGAEALGVRALDAGTSPDPVGPDLLEPGGAAADLSPAAVATDAALLRLGQLLIDRGYRFTTVTPATHARVNGRAGHEWARRIEDVFGWSRPFRAVSAGRDALVPPDLFEAMQVAGVAVRQGEGWRSSVRFSTLQGRLFVHSAYPTTASDAVFFGPDTYRFASAISSHLAGRRTPVRRAVDIGCGAGPGAVLIALAAPEAEVIGSDINDSALRFTSINARLAGTPNVVACRSDLLTSVAGSFDLIVANPPYLLDRGERAYRHGGGQLGEGLSLAIARLAGTRLAPGGALLLYTGSAIVDGVDGFKAALAPLFDDRQLVCDYRELDPDVFGEELLEPAYVEVDRIAAVLLTVSRSG